MLRERRIAAVITGLLVVGCATQPPTGPTSAPAPAGGAGDGGAKGYSLQEEPLATRIDVASAGATSTRNPAFFAPGNAIDANSHSAWAPAETDDAPSLTLDLGGARTVSGLKVKLSLGETASPENARVTVTVAAVAADGTVTPIASGWTPSESTLAALAIPATTTGTLRLLFDTGGAGGLRVCDAQVFEGATPSTEPSIGPSTEPSATPTPGDSPTPSPVEGVEVTSTRPGAWFVAGHAIDENLRSAWGPAPGDVAPTLTLDLVGEPTVTAVQLKLSAGGPPGPLALGAPGRVAVNVTAVAADGTTTTLAEIWRPTEGALETFDVPDTAASRIVFRFDADGADALLVCDANALTGPAPSASPSVEPSPSPTATPSVEPTPTPTATPSVEPTPTPTATPSVEPSPSPTATPTVEPTPTPSPSPYATTIPLSGANEVPPRITDATGSVEFRLSADGLTLDYDFTFSNLTNLTAAHIHTGLPGVNGPIVASLITGGVEGAPLTAASLAGSLAGATIADLVAMIQAGTVYVNVHTDDFVAPPDTGPGDFPSGELRGQVVP